MSHRGPEATRERATPCVNNASCIWTGHNHERQGDGDYGSKDVYNFSKCHLIFSFPSGRHIDTGCESFSKSVDNVRRVLIRNNCKGESYHDNASENFKHFPKHCVLLMRCATSWNNGRI